MVSIRVTEDFSADERAVAETLNAFARGRNGAKNQQELAALVARIGREMSARLVRKVIRDLRVKRHAPIVSAYKGNQEGGYFIPQTEAEAVDFARHVHNHALKMLAMESAVKKMMNQYFPQTELLFAGGGKEAA